MQVATPHSLRRHPSAAQACGACLLFSSLWLPASGNAQPQYFAPGIDLPSGAGRELVLQACTRCHDLKGVPAFKGYWTRQQWLAMIDTMIKHGAPLDAGQAGQVADYLALHFGRQPVSAAPTALQERLP